MPFFLPVLAAAARASPTTPQCGLCGLHKTCASPKMSPSGKGRRKILVVGEAPGRNEDEQGKPFVGESGRLLTDVLRKCGVELRQDCLITNALVCRPPDNRIEDDGAVDYCRPNLLRVVEEFAPETVVLLGGVAVRSLIGWLWKEGDLGGMARWAGWRIPCQKINAWVCPTFHPSHVLRDSQEKETRSGTSVLDATFRRHLAAACATSGRPFAEVPDYTKRVHVLTDLAHAARVVTRLAGGGRPVAFDYETDRLKPDARGARVLTCAVSDGPEAWAFPWHGEAVAAVGVLLASDVPKIAHNLKFEDRWTRKEFGRGVRNWLFDPMIGAHTLDNRPHVTGLKFQAFVRLGAGGYDAEVKPFMKSGGSNLPNRLKDFPILKLLEYNALDALLTHELARVQMAELGLTEE